MRRIISFILLTSCLFCFSSCIDDFNSQERAYDIGREYILGDNLKFKIENDVENEVFVITYDNINETNEELSFCFGFYDFNTTSCFYNPSYFEYSDNLGSIIIFNEDEYYMFTGDRIFYVSYKNSPDNIKTAIANSEYSISCFCGGFYVQN